MTDAKANAVAKAKADVMKHLASDNPGRKFEHLMKACGLSHGQVVDGLPHSRVLDRALKSLRSAGNIKCIGREWWLS